MTKEERKIYMTSYRTANKRDIAIKDAAYYAANIVKARAYYENNKDNISAYGLTYRANNKDRIVAYQAVYSSSNPEAARRAKHKRRALKLNCGGALSKGITEKLLTLQKGKCACCKKSVKDGHHLDHIMPLAFYYDFYGNVETRADIFLKTNFNPEIKMTIKFKGILTTEEALAAVINNGHALRYVHEQTPEAVLAAVTQDGYALQYVLSKDLFISIAAKLNIEI